MNTRGKVGELKPVSQTIPNSLKPIKPGCLAPTVPRLRRSRCRIGKLFGKLFDDAFFQVSNSNTPRPVGGKSVQAMTNLYARVLKELGKKLTENGEILNMGTVEWRSTEKIDVDFKAPEPVTTTAKGKWPILPSKE